MNIIDVVAQESGEPGAALPHLAEIIVGFVAFSVLVYLIGRYVWPTFTKSYEDHNQRVEAGMQRAETEQQQARDELARNRERLAGVDDEAARIRDDARADAERIKEDMAAKASEEADRIVGQGRQTLDASRSRTVSELRGEVGSQSVELARRMVAASLSDESRRSESVDSFLDQLEGMAGGNGTGDGRTASGNGAAAPTAGTGAGT
jgi:F-type H+-transporting ATPase subunit b